MGMYVSVDIIIHVLTICLCCNVYIYRFEISPSVKPCTKGLWIWGKPIPLSNQHGQNFRLLLVDTEGIGSFGASETHDHQVGHATHCNTHT